MFEEGLEPTENEPAYVGAVLQRIAEIKEIDIDKLGPIIKKTSRLFFRL